MRKSLKLLVLTTIALLSCSTSWCQSKLEVNDTISFKGDSVQTDSLVTIPISMIKIANSKMVELKYEKEINRDLRSIIANDSLVIYGLSTELDNTLRESEIRIKKIKKERNIAVGVSAGVAALLLLLLLK